MVNAVVEIRNRWILNKNEHRLWTHKGFHMPSFPSFSLPRLVCSEIGKLIANQGYCNASIN